MLGNAVSERTTNFCWSAVEQVRDLCFYFLSSSFLLLPIFSLFSNNTTRYDLPNRQSIISSVQSSPCQSSPAQPSQDQPPAQQASQERFGNIKIPFINKGIEFIDLPSIFMDRSVTSSIPAYFQNSEPPIICYKYNKPIRNTVFNFNKLVSDLDIHANTPESWDCKDSKFIYPAAGHIMTGNLKIISDSRIRYIVSKGPKYRFPSRIDFKKYREEIASALNDFGNRWCKREYVEPDALKEWKVSIFKIGDQRIKFYS